MQADNDDGDRMGLFRLVVILHLAWCLGKFSTSFGVQS
jgi:hypothetical protein